MGVCNVSWWAGTPVGGGGPGLALIVDPEREHRRQPGCTYMGREHRMYPKTEAEAALMRLSYHLVRWRSSIATAGPTLPFLFLFSSPSPSPPGAAPPCTTGSGCRPRGGSAPTATSRPTKFLVKPRLVSSSSSHGSHQYLGGDDSGSTRKPNRDILDHDRKRRTQLRLLLLEEDLVDQGYTRAEISQRLDDARKALEVETQADTEKGPAAPPPPPRLPSEFSMLLY